jgi:GT2 family glycosyltransferase
MTPASIVIPTRGRPRYLEVALASIAPQAARAGAELLVVDDAGASPQLRALSERFGARYEPHPVPQGLNAARNTGIARSQGELVVFVDDDVEARPGWLQALLDAARANPDVDIFTGPVRARLEGDAPRSCGREQPPVTTLELGDADTDAEFAWGANMAIRRSALERGGPFDATLEVGSGDEQEWQEQLREREPRTRVRYVAGAALDHRRSGADARLRALVRSAYGRGRAARRFDVRRGRAPSPARELVTLAGCAGHVLRRRCPAGLTMVAHSAGRLSASAGPAGRRSGPPARATGPTADDFLSGSSGTVGGLDSLRRRAQDALTDVEEIAGGRRARLALAARREPPTRRVLALGVVRPERRRLAAAIERELLRSRHRVELHTRPPGDGGKFENLNELLVEHPATGHDWLLVIDDDVQLPHGFLDRLLFLCERFSLSLAQPAHRLDSHAAWDVTRRRRRSAARETNFVEIGPVTVFARATFEELLPFPQLRMGWGLDVHWAAIARARGWRCGVIDAVPVRHRAAPAARDYPREEAIAEARAFLAEREHVTAAEAQRTLATHHSW